MSEPIQLDGPHTRGYNGDTLQVGVFHNYLSQCYDLQISGQQNQKGWVGKLQIEEAGFYEVTEPTLRLSRDECQALLETLWAAGLRPREVGTAGQLSATERHLNDMRAIVATKLSVGLPTT